MNSLVHGTAEIEPGLRLHYVTSGEGDRVLVLLHGFPQTWRAWRRLIPLLAAEGFRVIAPDYRGAGNSSRPPGGYDKKTLAGDIRGHWIAEENAEGFLSGLLAFLRAPAR